jgi:hypothetical protein
MEASVPINKIIHEAIEIAVQTQLRCLVKDIAGTLGKETGPLLKSIAGAKKISYYVYSEPGDEDIDINERKCQHLVLINKNFLTRCCEPLLWMKDSKTCLHHSLKPSPYTNMRLPVLYKHRDMLIDKESGCVYNSNIEIADAKTPVIGRYYRNKIILFDTAK